PAVTCAEPSCTTYVRCAARRPRSRRSAPRRLPGDRVDPGSARWPCPPGAGRPPHGRGERGSSSVGVPQHGRVGMDADEPRRRTERRGGLGPWLREAGIIVVSALVLSMLIKTFLVQAFFIPSGSMEETLAIGDRVLVTKLAPGPLSVHRGDVVVF